MEPPRIAADEEMVLPLLVGERGRVGGPRDMGFAAIDELDLRPLGVAVGAVDQKHPGSPQCATAAAAASSISRPVVKRSRGWGAVIGCGRSRAMGFASTGGDRGVDLSRGEGG